MRVLVVEDYRPLADLVAEGLSDQGMAADVAYDGIEAVGKLGVNTYDVVVLDRTLPGVPGDTLCRMISGSDGRAMVLMLSGAASPEERVDGLGLGADDYLVKPFHFPELVMRVRALAGRRPRAVPRVLRAGGVELDCLSRLARRQGRPLALSAKELAVLEALMGASPGYLSAEQLLEKAWDENADPFTKTVTVTIGRLRRKLGEPQLIETTTGLGYRLIGPKRDEWAVVSQLRAVR
jgi:DNA-binding response OmpR family regulator